MLLAEDFGVEDAARRIERIDGRVDAELGDLTREDRRGIEVRERTSLCRVRQVIGRDID